MPKIFSYEVDGLSYTVTVFEENGGFYADIAVDEGQMDVNAIYFGDDDFSGSSESLSGPLNMNGVRLDGERVQWDDAAKLSDPGIGPEGDDKETFLHAGDTLRVELDIESLDEIDVFGIRATSTSTESGSIKAVSDDPEEPEEPEDPEEPTFEKVLFGAAYDENGNITDGLSIFAEPQTEDEYAPEPGTEPTFANYVAAFEENPYGYDPQDIQQIDFFTVNESGWFESVGSLAAPEGGFASGDDMIAAYEEALENGTLDFSGLEDGAELIASLGIDLPEDDMSVEDDMDPEPEDDALMM
ncbi:hypothetical protein JYP51_06220 [Ponticoccus gilvus]|nr:hypothetical protein [Enemella evansiae]